MTPARGRAHPASGTLNYLEGNGYLNYSVLASFAIAWEAPWSIGSPCPKTAR